MGKFLIGFVSLSLILAFVLNLHAQDLNDVKEVQRYYLGFMDNLLIGDPIRPTLVITALENEVEGFIQYNGNRVDFNLNQGEVFEHETNSNLVIETNKVVETKGVYVYSEGEVSVYALNIKSGSTDGTLVLPFESLGSDYFIASHYENQTKGISLGLRQFNNESQALIVGTEDNTQIQIIPSAPVSNSTDPIFVTLNEGETYQIKSKQDLTGTQITVLNSGGSCGRIAIFSGNKLADIGDPECGIFSSSHIFNQNEPVSSWGKEFFHIPLRNRQLGELVKFIAAFDNTEVYSGNNLIATLDAGEFYTADVDDGEALHFTSSEPVAVFGFGKSYSCLILDENSVQSPANVNNYGNPLMVNYLPFEKLYTNLTFLAQRVDNTSMHYAQIVTLTSSVAQMEIDGQSVANSFSPINNNPDYSYAQIMLNPGVHEISNPNGFTGFFYAVGGSNSYAVSFGQEFENASYEVTSSFDSLVTGSPRIACINQEGEWGISSSNPDFTFFSWDFGDGSGLKSGSLVNHTYTEPGTYPVKVFASESDTGCEETELHFFEVMVEELDGEIAGPINACPFVDIFEYTFTGIGEIDRIEWRVDGGTLISQTDSTATIQWGEANNNASIRVVPYGENGCVGNEIEYPVTVRQDIEAEIPEGIDFICDPAVSYSYNVMNPISSRAYEWEVIGGNILGNSTGSQIEVIWGEGETEGTVFYREYSLLDDLCEGTSPFLEVTINSEFRASIQEVVDVSCFGEEDGQIQVQVEGGVSPFVVEWSHDSSLQNTTAENLVAGTYSVKIIDSQGCEIEIEDIIVSEPALFELLSFDLQDVSCFGKTDGSIAMRLQGGVMPYTTTFPNAVINQDVVTVEGLENGLFQISILDANGCEITEDFEIKSPEPLEVSFEIIKDPCPGEQNGTIRAELVGGTSPFTYEWSNGEITETLDFIGRGVYEVTIFDAQGCAGVGTFVLEEAIPQIRFPTGFDPLDGGFGPVSNCETNTYSLSIYNRWGQLIYYGDGPWNGDYQGKASPLGTYTYRFDYAFLINDQMQQETLMGAFTKIR